MAAMATTGANRAGLIAPRADERKGHCGGGEGQYALSRVEGGEPESHRAWPVPGERRVGPTGR